MENEIPLPEESKVLGEFFGIDTKVGRFEGSWTILSIRSFWPDGNMCYFFRNGYYTTGFTDIYGTEAMRQVFSEFLRGGCSITDYDGFHGYGTRNFAEIPPFSNIQQLRISLELKGLSRSK